MDLVVRTDATASIGTGHAMRCATLIDEWASASFGGATVVGTIDIPFVRRRLAATGAALIEITPRSDRFVLVVDSYDQAIRMESLRIPGAALTVLVDDLGGAVDGYDVVWNPNAYPAHDMYPGFNGRIISERVPIRSGLPAWRGGSNRIGVSLGGGNPAPSLVEAMTRWAKSLPVPPISPNAQWIPRDWVEASQDEPWQAFADCDVLMTAAGSTIWEAAHVGIPVCALQTVQNQARIAQWLRANDAPVVDVVSPMNLEELSRSLVKGVKAASRLPRIENGAPEAAATLYSWAS
jgi:UDP-2,4-diacetamido-2,4,6-trideoxy-beta-L-altropyranose hydrolase